MAKDVYSLVMRGTCSGEFWETIQHYESSNTSAVDPVTAASNLIAGFRSNVEPDINAIQAADNFVTGYSAKRVNNGGSPTVMLPIAPVAGAVAGTSATCALAYLIVGEYATMMRFRTHS